MTAHSIDTYRRVLEKDLQAGNDTERTHYPALKTLIQSLAAGITATIEPKRVACGAPDFVVSRKARHGDVTLGYMEAKNVDEPLDDWERDEQIKRYLSDLPNRNFILTDYLEFRWYVAGKRLLSARLARASKGGKLTLIRDDGKDGAKAVTDLLTAFLSQQAEPISDPKALALRMARLTHFIRDMIVTAFDNQTASATLRDLHGAFEKALIPDLPIPQFADMFAQTLAYGLFAARCNHHGQRGTFKRLGAASEIPKTNPFLRQLFETITGTALDDEPYVGFVDDLAQLLADTVIEGPDGVLANFGKRTARQDPVVHFYETFLAAYDPKLREARGVYYTPEPVVSYIVRSVDYLLKTRFGCPNGLADTATVEYEREEENGGKPKKVKATSHRVLILDPACGTGTFLYTVIDHIRNEFMGEENAGIWSGYVRKDLLPRIFGFELLMAPYAVAHFKLGMQLAGQDLHPGLREKWAYDFSGKERLGVFLTNTLEEATKKVEMLFGSWIAREANAAVRIKRELPILVVMGNPPYSGHSANRSDLERIVNPGESYQTLRGTTKVAQRTLKIREKTFIGQLIEHYKKVDGKGLGERNPKWLQDDYVKFIRWGQWRIERAGAGVLAFITNNGYLDNPTFRGMRQQLMKAFTEIYILDLHGSSKKQETAPDGSPDKNVFDIQQGVTLGIFVKEPGKKSPGKVYHAELLGLREAKNRYLSERAVSSTLWKPLKPAPPFYSFVPEAGELRAEYDFAWKLMDAAPVNVLGFQTHRDHFAIDFEEAPLRTRIAALRNKSKTDEELRTDYSLADNRDWHLSEARKLLRSDAKWDGQFIRCLYRPFDWRPCYFSTVAMDYPRRELLDHVAHRENLCLGVGRQGLAVNDPQWSLIACSREPVDANIFRRGGINVFPLYLYPATEGETPTRWPTGPDRRQPNLNPDFIAELQDRLGLSFASDGRGDLQKTFGPEDVFHYIYAVFHSPTYRTRYAEFLKSDFPRLPLTSDVNLFRSLCGLGAELVALHLLESPKLSKPIARFPVKGTNLVEKGFPKYFGPGELAPGMSQPLEAGRVYISKAEPRGPLADARGSDGLLPHGCGSDGAPEGQYFEGVPPEVWNFHIGGYQVCEKWLKDRRGRTLTYEDLEHYSKVVTALQETIRLMAEIDAAIPHWPLE
ncbi:MAG: hypothetical protein A3J28_04810 [Acidobacteria bacterium RIFCSPLOWO2_12_FULL_60_22]|nr:MAG: hypothetical protein A3J28_04810 [Acidobacteria bacterium RIFCSPLOWO2_12_FULL_60_22]